MKYARIIGGMASLLLAAGASAQWSDNFDSYPDGTVLDGIGGWEGWDGDGSVAGVVSSDESRSGPHSILVTSNADAIHPFSGYTSGQWVFTAYQYVPSGLDAATYFLLQNVYQHFGPYDWGVQLMLDPTTDEVHDDMQDFYGSGSNYLPAVYDQWVEIRVEIDLDNNYVETYYNGDLVSSGEWDTLLDGDVAIANLDLYAPHAGNVYYDDLSLESANACIADFNGDGNVNTQDVIAFLNAWNAGAGNADINGDGNVNTQDVILFLNLWNAGC